MAFTNETQVRLVTGDEALAIARRSGAAGQWLVERKWQLTGTTRPEASYFVKISSHTTENGANRALAKLNAKIAAKA